MKTGRRTIKDVARLAGVSLGSTSRALSGAANVSEAMIERVRRAAASLGYSPNHAARSLRSRNTKTIGCMFSDMSNPLYARLFCTLEEGLARDLVRAVQQARRDAGLDVSDRIALTIAGSDEVQAAARAHEQLITAETLATSYDVQQGPGGEPQVSVTKA